MTDAPYGGLPPTGRPMSEVLPEGETYSGNSSSTTETAKDQASQVGQTAKDSGQRVAGTAAEQGKNVLHEGQRQVRNLTSEVGQQVHEQSSVQKAKATSGLRSLGDELGSMAANGGQSGIASDLAQQAASKAHELAGWLEARDPGTLVEELRGIARRKPGTFLLGAVAAGIVAGRLTRGAVDAARSDDDSPSGTTGTVTPPATPLATTGTVPVAGAADDTYLDLPADPVTGRPGEYSDVSVGGYR